MIVGLAVAANQFSEKNDIELYFVYIPMPHQIYKKVKDKWKGKYHDYNEIMFDFSVPNRYFKSQMDLYGMSFIDLTELFLQYAEKDNLKPLYHKYIGHWSEIGINITANYLNEKVLKVHEGT